MGQARNPYRRGRASTVYLPVQTLSDQQLLIFKEILLYFTKQAILRRATVLSLPLQ